MADRSAIEWLNGGSTWNWLVGCSPASPGCANGYCVGFTRRLAASIGGPYAEAIRAGRFSGKVLVREDKLDLPEHWAKPRLVFVNSLSDTFHESVPDAVLDRAFSVMARADWHTYIVLTKRAERMREYLSLRYLRGATPRAHVWLGVTTENQAAADERIPHLLATPAAVRFLSCEPLLGPVDLRQALVGDVTWDSTGREVRRAALDWVIAGGESGPGARPCWVPDVRSIVRQCQKAGVPVFVKQLGANVQDRNDAGWDGCEPADWPEHLLAEDRIEHDEADTGYQGAPVRVRTRHRKGADPQEWPADLRVREMPHAR